MYAELLAGADAETQADYASRIENRAVHLGDLVDGLFDYAKLRAGSVRITLEPISVSQLARACVGNGASILGEHPVEVEASDLVALADRTAMNRILENLLSNAAKYSAADAPVTIGFAATPDRVRVTVTDRGRGIAPDDLDTVFGELARAPVK